MRLILALCAAILASSSPAAAGQHSRLFRRVNTTAITGFLGTIANSTANSNTTSYGSNASAITENNGFKSVGYFADWSVYGPDAFSPQDIPATALTHVIYAFAGINPDNGSAYLNDPYADTHMKFPGDQNSTNSDDLYGSMKQIFLLKKANRNLKSSLSFGGWSMGSNVSQGLSTAAGRQTFAKESVQMMGNLGFDGVDLDWEYPNTTADAANLVDVCQRLRASLDRYSASLSNAPHFLLSLAVPAAPAAYSSIDVAGVAPSVDFLNLMAYDYAGSFSTTAGHASNVLLSNTDAASTAFATDPALDHYIDAGLPSWKLVLGFPLYGHVFNQTRGPGTAFTNDAGVAGTPDYKAIALDGTNFAPDILASWAYDNATQQMISFDHPATAVNKTQFLKAHRLGGAMSWSLDGERPLNDSQSLVRTVSAALDVPAGLGMEFTANNLNYPDSVYANLRNGMSGE